MHLAGQTQAALEGWTQARGAKAGAARALARALLAEFAQQPMAERPAQALLAEARTVFSSDLPRAEAVTDPDGSVRFVVHLEDGNIVETVLIHQRENETRARSR
jgi:adenine C2-methylase RlmN of 23S rRNA A2503 and tRNA A37